MQDNVSKKLFETIVGPVLYDSNSPYKLMTKKLNDIDIDYFEGPFVLGDRLDDVLRIEIKKKILKDFIDYGNMLIRDYSDKVERRVKCAIGEWITSQPSREVALVQLDEVFQGVHDFTRKTLTYVPLPMYSKSELKDLYDAAMKVTLFERVTQRYREETPLPCPRQPTPRIGYDRNTSLETLRFIVKEGFSISK